MEKMKSKESFLSKQASKIVIVIAVSTIFVGMLATVGVFNDRPLEPDCIETRQVQTALYDYVYEKYESKAKDIKGIDLFPIREIYDQPLGIKTCDSKVTVNFSNKESVDFKVKYLITWLNDDKNTINIDVDGLIDN